MPSAGCEPKSASLCSARGPRTRIRGPRRSWPRRRCGRQRHARRVEARSRAAASARNNFGRYWPLGAAVASTARPLRPCPRCASQRPPAACECVTVRGGSGSTSSLERAQPFTRSSASSATILEMPRQPGPAGKLRGCGADLNMLVRHFSMAASHSAATTSRRAASRWPGSARVARRSCAGRAWRRRSRAAAAVRERAAAGLPAQHFMQ
jgi:hypothetical protein